jgi:hypothetical protein
MPIMVSIVLCTIPQITSDFVNDKNGDIQNMTAYVLWVYPRPYHTLRSRGSDSTI